MYTLLIAFYGFRVFYDLQLLLINSEFAGAGSKTGQGHKNLLSNKIVLFQGRFHLCFPSLREGGGGEKSF